MNSSKNKFKDLILASKDYINLFAVSSSDFSTEDDHSWSDQHIQKNRIKTKNSFDIFESTSEEPNIRHALTNEEQQHDFEDEEERNEDDIDNIYDDSFDLSNYDSEESF